MTKHENGLPTIFIDNLFQFMTFLGLFFALLYGAYGLVFLTLLLLFMVNGSKLWCRLSLMHLHCRLSVDKKKVFPGEEFSLKAEVTNGKILPVSVQLQLSLDKTLLEETISESSALLWFQKVIWQWELQAKRRGCYKLGPSQLYAGDLFGFFQRQKEFKPLEELIVYPRLLPINELPLPLQELLGSKEVNSPVVDPLYSTGTRDYQPGRPARHIHWKASARHNRLQEKTFAPTSQLKAFLAIDVAGFAENKAEDSFEHTLEIAASLAASLDRRGIPVGLAANGSLHGDKIAYLPLAKGERQLPLLLEKLARLKLERQGTLQEIFEKSIHLPWGTSCIYFCHQVEQTALKTKALLQQKNIPVIIVAGDAPADVAYENGELYNLKQFRGSGVVADVR